MKDLLQNLDKALKTIEEERSGEDPIEAYRKDLIQVLDLPPHASMEDVLNYIKDLVKKIEALTQAIDEYVES